MKISKLIFLAAVLFTMPFKMIAQKQLLEGSITYNIIIQSGKNEDAVKGNLSGAKLDLFLRPNISRSEMTSALGTESTVYDSKLGKGFILKEYSGQKLMITATKENWAQKNQWNNDLKFTIDNTVVDILGYNCKKATAITADGKKFEVYFTPDIVIANKQYNNSFDQLPGLPVQYEVSSGSLVFKYSLFKISYDQVATAKFEVPKTGFRIMTYEENQQLKKETK